MMTQKLYRGVFKNLGRTETIGISVEIFIHWIANNNPPWATYRVFMPGSLSMLDKQPNAHSVGVRENWRRLFAKCVLKKFTVLESTYTFLDNQLCFRLKAVIYGDVHSVPAIWEANSNGGGHSTALLH